ncbi:MAG: long-chain fatty acid--CoA ligase [bacterium]
MPVRWDIGYIVRKRAGLSPDKTAVIFEDRPVTYRELNEGVNRAAHFLQAKGIRRGDRVALVLLNCVEFLEIYFACAKIGAILVPLNWRLVGPELKYQLDDCGTRMLVFHDAFVKNVDTIRRQLGVEPDKLVFMTSAGPGDGAGATSACPGWAEDYHALTRGLPATEPVLNGPVCFDDPLAIIYTSGTTGNPKGAVLTHEQTFFKNFQIAFYTEARPGDVFLSQMPLFHSGGLFVVATPALCAGMTLLMRKGFDPAVFAEDIQRYKATVVLALTTMWRMVLDAGKLDRVDVSSVRCVLGGGERTPPSLFDALAKRGLYMQQGFGQTENSAMMALPKEDIHRKMGSVGKPGFFTDIWIGGPDGERLPPGEIGEIVATGPTVMNGYWNLPETTARTIVGDVLLTGDLGYVDEEGYFYIVDRAKDMYRTGGENVYPAEVEKILAGHPKISNAAIIGIPDEKWGETGMAFIVPVPGATVTEQEIYDFLEGKAAKFKHPRHVRFLDALPLTPTMKVKKAELKEKYSKGMFDTVPRASAHSAGAV